MAKLLLRGKHQLSIPLVGQAIGEPSLEVSVGNTQALEGPILPGEEVHLVGANQNTFAVCPDEVQLEVIELRFGDGSNLRSGQDWRASAEVLSVARMSLETFPKTLTFETVVNVSIDAKGKVVKANVRDESAGVQDWFRGELQKWKFRPALIKGEPQPSQATLLYRIHRVFDFHDPTQFDDALFHENTPILPIDVYSESAIPGAKQAIIVGRALMLGP